MAQFFSNVASRVSVLVINVYGSGVSSYTHALFIKYMVLDAVGQYAVIAWVERRLHYSIVSCLLKHLTRKIKL